MRSDYWLLVDERGHIVNACHSSDGPMDKPNIEAESGCEWRPRQHVSTASIAAYEAEHGF